MSPSHLYDVLGVRRDASQSDIKKAYRALAMKHHPDKGGSAENFKEIGEAFNILGDPSKRSAYDRGSLDDHGNRNQNQNTSFGASVDPFDIFRNFFNEDTFGHHAHHKKPQLQQVTLRISLEDTYNGKSTIVKITRQGCCVACNGVGGTNPPAPCIACNGVGRVRRVIQLAPGMVQQSIGQCTDCGGSGSNIESIYICAVCVGQCTIEETVNLSLDIKAGTSDGDKILIRSHGDYNVHTKKHNDISIVLQQKQHHRIKRKGDDLLIEQVIPLFDAITQTKIRYHHLDGKEYCLLCNNVVSPGSVFKVSGLGMPRSDRSYGNLYVSLKINFPADTVSDTSLSLDKALKSTYQQAIPQDLPIKHLVRSSLTNDKPGSCNQQ